jgi:hypothetical protein
VCLFALFAMGGGAAWAQGSVAVLGVEHIDVPDSLAQQLTDALRQRASGTSGIRVVQGKELIEIKMVFSCESEAPACMAQAGKSLGADKLLYGTLKKGGKPNSVVVALKLLDVKTASIEKFVNETVSKRDLASGSVNASAAKWFSSLVEVESKPTLTVTSEPANAAVAVDGQPAGRTPVTLRDLSPGAHVVAVSMSGRAPSTRTVELRAGGNHELAFQLEADAKQPVATKVKPEPLITAPQPVITPTPLPPVKGHPGRTAKILALTTLAGAVVAGGVAIYTWRTYTGLEDTAHNDLIRLRPGMPTDEQTKFFNSPSCTPPTSLGSSPEIESYKRNCSSGETYANATTALWVVAGALATASVISYVVGDRQAAKANEKKTTARIIRQSLKVAPVFSNQGGALSAAFEF